MLGLGAVPRHVSSWQISFRELLTVIRETSPLRVGWGRGRSGRAAAVCTACRGSNAKDSWRGRMTSPLVYTISDLRPRGESGFEPETFRRAEQCLAVHQLGKWMGTDNPYEPPGPDGSSTGPRTSQLPALALVDPFISGRDCI